MNKLFSRMLPALIIALSLCFGALSLTACGEKDMVFTGQGEMRGMKIDCTLTLATDGTAKLAAVIDTEIQSIKDQIEPMLQASGTFEVKDNVYTVTLGEGATARTFTSTYDSATKTHTIAYSIVGPEGSVPVTLTCKA